MLGQNIGRVGLPDMSAGGRPSLTLDFVGIPVLNERITFSRTSGATWFSPDGVLEGVDFSTSSVAIGTGSKTFTLNATAGANRYWAIGDLVRVSQQSNSANFMEGTVTSYTVSTQVLVIDVTSTGGSGTIASWRVSSHMPRFDFNPTTLAAQGLLIEEARTNLLTYSDQFDNLAWVKAAATVTANATASPDGTVNADKLIATAVSANHYLSSGTVTISAGASVTASVYVKAAEYNTIRIAAYNSAITSGFRVDANLSTVTGTTGTLGTGSATGSSVTNVGGGWYRVTVSGTIDASSTGIVMWVQMLAAGVTPFLGDGTSGIFVFGAQLEAGAFPTSYIPTTTTALTRSQDRAVVSTLAPWFNATTGTIYAEFALTQPVSGANQFLARFSDNGYNNSIVDNVTGSGFAQLATAAGGVFDGVAGTSPAVSANTVTKFAGAYATNDLAASKDGGTVATDNTATIPSGLTRFDLGSDHAGSNNIKAGYLRRVTFYPRRLSNAELVSITS